MSLGVVSNIERIARKQGPPIPHMDFVVFAYNKKQKGVIGMFRLLGTLISGAIVGWIAGQIMGTKSSLLRNIVVGIIGSFVGSFLSGILGIWAYGWLASTIVSVIGACIFLWLGQRLFR